MPCAPQTTFPLPTLKDLYGWKEACAHCDKAGVYAKAIAKPRPDQYILPLRPLSPVIPKVAPNRPYVPTTPMPQTPPRTIILASCVPEPPEDEVIEWIPTEPMNKSVPHVNASLPPDNPAGGVALRRFRPEGDSSDSMEDDMEFTCSVCLGSGKLLEDLCPLCDGESRPSACAKMGACLIEEALELNNVEMTAEDKLKYDQVDITMDSGAGAPVADPKDFPGCEVTDSPGALAGQMFVTPDGTKIANTGQFEAKVRLDDGRVTKSTYQAVAVRKPLMSVSSVNDKGSFRAPTKT